GQSLGSLWRAYEASTVEKTPPDPQTEPAKQLTSHAYLATGPRFVPPACEKCSEEIVYSVRTPDRFPAMLSINPDGTKKRELATRYLGSTVGASRDGIVFDQEEIHDNVALRSDLYWLDRRTDRVHALTSNARLLDPDLSPDGMSVACVREGA